MSLENLIILKKKKSKFSQNDGKKRVKLRFPIGSHQAANIASSKRVTETS